MPVGGRIVGRCDCTGRSKGRRREEREEEEERERREERRMVVSLGGLANSTTGGWLAGDQRRVGWPAGGLEKEIKRREGERKIVEREKKK